MEDRIFVALQRAVLKPKDRDVGGNVWISETMWRLFDERVFARRDPAREQSLIWRFVWRHCSKLEGR